MTFRRPALDWSLTATSTRILDCRNAIGAAMPLATWRPRPVVRLRGRLAGAPGMGQLQMTGTMPSGHTGTLMPQRMYYIDGSRAELNGEDLGSFHPADL